MMSHDSLLELIRFCPWSDSFLSSDQAINAQKIPMRQALALAHQMVSKNQANRLHAISEKASSKEQSASYGSSFNSGRIAD